MSSLQLLVTNQFAFVFTVISFISSTISHTQTHTTKLLLYTLLSNDIQLLHLSFLTIHIIYRRCKSVISNLLYIYQHLLPAYLLCLFITVALVYKYAPKYSLSWSKKCQGVVSWFSLCKHLPFWSKMAHPIFLLIVMWQILLYSKMSSLTKI